MYYILICAIKRERVCLYMEAWKKPERIHEKL